MTNCSKGQASSSRRQPMPVCFDFATRHPPPATRSATRTHASANIKCVLGVRGSTVYIANYLSAQPDSVGCHVVNVSEDALQNRWRLFSFWRPGKIPAFFSGLQQKNLQPSGQSGLRIPHQPSPVQHSMMAQLVHTQFSGL